MKITILNGRQAMGWNVESGFRRAQFEYDCPSCGDHIEGAGEEDLLTVMTHRLLHEAGDWKRGLFLSRFAIDATDSARTTE